MQCTERDVRKFSFLIFLSFVLAYLFLTIYRDSHPSVIALTTGKFEHELECEKLRGEVEDPRVENLVSALDNQLFLKLKYRPLLNCMASDDKYLVDVIKNDYLEKWDWNNYNLTQEKTAYTFDSQPQAKDIYEKIFKNKKNGIFVESGAHTCDKDSITLPFELNLNWTGLLVEPYPAFYDSCVQTRRKSMYMNSCLAIKKYPHYSHFDYSQILSGLQQDENAVMPGISLNMDSGALQMQCFPLYSMLLSLQNPTVNLLVLDVEGADYLVLKTIPWDKVDIEVISVETKQLGRTSLEGSRKLVIELLTEAGYSRFDHTETSAFGEDPLNDLFVRNDIVKKYNVV